MRSAVVGARMRFTRSEFAIASRVVDRRLVVAPRRRALRALLAVLLWMGAASAVLGQLNQARGNVQRTGGDRCRTPLSSSGLRRR
jgi:hypothetical protein